MIRCVCYHKGGVFFNIMKIAVVTGASSGMGRCFVLSLDRDERFDEIWVVARRRDRLEALAGETRAKIRPIPLDLTLPESVSEYGSLLESEKPDVAVLVNAGGYGIFKAFTDMNEADIRGMIDLNSRALALMTYATLPYMKSGGRIYELGSLSSFQPVPCLAVYAASKAFVVSLSRALNVELKERGIRVMAVCPGWVKTEFFDRAKTDDTISYFNRYFTPEQVVGRALRDMKRGRDLSIAGFSVRFQVLLVKLLPHKLVMKVWCRQQHFR